MRLSTVTWNDILGYYTGTDALDEHLSAFFDTPFRYFELDMSCSPGKDDFGRSSMWLEDGDRWKSMIERVGGIAKDHGYQFISAHAMSQDYYFDDDLKEKFYRAIRRSFEACSMLGIPQIVVHGLNLWKPSDKNPETVFRVNREFYLRLADAAEQYNVDMLAENFQADCSDGYPFTTGALMMDFLAKADIPRLHLNWDVGHANIDNPHLQYDDIIAMGSELRSIHVHDNWGNVDCHSIPFSGSVNFDQVIRGLMDTGYKGTFNLEASDLFVISNEEGRGRKRLCRNPGDKLSDPPKHIITAYYNLLYQMGKWMLDEYHLFEE